MVQGCPAVEKADVPLDIVRQVIFLNNGGPIEQPTYKPVRYATKQGGDHRRQSCPFVVDGQ